MSIEKVKYIDQTLTHLKDIRRDYEEDVDEVIKFVNHSRRTIKDATGTKGKRTGQDVYDGTAMGAVNLAVDGICGYSFSKSYRWFEYTLPNKLNFPKWSGMRAWNGKKLDEYPDVKQWLEDVEEVMYGAYLRSNFYDIAPEMVRNALTVGTTHLICEEDLAKGCTIFIDPHFREVYIAEDRFGRVDTQYHECNYTLRQFVDKFGLEVMKRADPNFPDKFKNNPFSTMTVIHAIFPRKDYQQGRIDASNKPYASVWVLSGGGEKAERLLLESGYDESSIVSWRWRKNNDEMYGRSPSWDSLIDIKKANQQGKSNLIAGHKMVEPPLVAIEDLRGKIMNAPGGKTFVSRDLPPDYYPRPLQEGISLPYAIEQQERSDKIIRDHFSVDFFLMLAQAASNKVPLTATQVIEMGGEKAAVLGTKIARMETEALNPIHDRMFAIEDRAGRIPEVPQILMDYAGGHIEIDYLGPLAQAQKRIFKSQVIRSGMQMVGEAANYFPEVRHVIDPIKTLRDLLSAQGFPTKDLRTDEQIDAIIQQEQQQAEAQRTLQEGIEMAKAGSRLTKTIEPGSPLEKLMGGGQGQGGGAGQPPM